MRLYRAAATFDLELGALAGLTSAADKVPYFTGSGAASVADFTAAGRALVDDASAAAQRATLSIVQIDRLLGSLTGADFNVTTDQAITISFATNYIIRKIIVTNASISLTTAQGGFYTATAKGGDTLVAATQAYTALTAAAKYLDATLAAIVTTDRRTEGTLYLSLTTGQGAAATADVYIFGDVLA